MKNDWLKKKPVNINKNDLFSKILLNPINDLSAFKNETYIGICSLNHPTKPSHGILLCVKDGLVWILEVRDGRIYWRASFSHENSLHLSKIFINGYEFVTSNAAKKEVIPKAKKASGHIFRNFGGIITSEGKTLILIHKQGNCVFGELANDTLTFGWAFQPNQVKELSEYFEKASVVANGLNK